MPTLHYICRLLIDPTDLRQALDQLPGKSIRIGEMSDPSEVLDTIFECLRVPDANLAIT